MEDAEMKDAASWELSQTFTSDGGGIRCACVVPANVTPSEEGGPTDAFRVITGSQGGGLCDYGVPSGNMNIIPYQHNHGVTALLSHEHWYVTGCKDSVIRIFDSRTNSLVGKMEGHEKPVTSLSWANPADNAMSDGEKDMWLISGSWDGTAKIWNFAKRSLIATLPNHENSVCVCGLPSSKFNTMDANNMLYVATGSAGVASNNKIAGHTVRVWSIDSTTCQTKLMHSIANDHDGPIRGICLTTPHRKTLATCSNDGTVRIRLMETGESISILTFLPSQQQQQQPPMLLSCAEINHRGVVSSAEDGTVVVWNSIDQQPQIIPHAQCVWNVLKLPNNDFATCCDDGILRIFSCDSTRYATQEEREQFTKSVVDATAKKSSGPSSEEIAKLPKWEMCSTMVGKSEGQVQVFQKDGVAIAAQYSVASGTWIEVGQVMGTNENTGTIDGTKYDHVLPIEVDQTGGTVANLKIGYNNGENAFVAAQRFVDAHVLPQHHLTDIADYINQRVGNQTPTIGMSSSNNGAAAFSPSAATTGVPITSFEYIPIKSFKSFELTEKAAKTTFEKMKTKLQSFEKLSEQQLITLSSLTETLAVTNRYHSSKVEDLELKLMDDMLDLFSTAPDQIFPAIDLARLTILHPDGITDTRCSTYWNQIIQKVMNQNNNNTAGIAIPMLSLRLYTNAIKSGKASRDIIIQQNLDTILKQTTSCIASKNKNIRLSVATLIYNISFSIYKNDVGDLSVIDSVACNVVTMIDTAIGTKSYESEALFRLLVSLGTLVVTNKKANDLAKSLFLGVKVQPAASPHTDIVKRAANEVYSILA